MLHKLGEQERFSLRLENGLRLYLFSPESVADGDIDENLVQFSAVVQSDNETIANSSFRRVMIVQSDLWIFDTIHFCT